MSPEGDYKILAKKSGSDVYVDIVDIKDVSIDGESYKVGEMEMRLKSPVTVSMSVQLYKASIIKFAHTVTGTTNNYLRMNGGRPVRFRTLRRAEKRWS